MSRAMQVSARPSYLETRFAFFDLLALGRFGSGGSESIRRNTSNSFGGDPAACFGVRGLVMVSA